MTTPPKHDHYYTNTSLSLEKESIHLHYDGNYDEPPRRKEPVIAKPNSVSLLRRKVGGNPLGRDKQAMKLNKPMGESDNSWAPVPT